MGTMNWPEVSVVVRSYNEPLELFKNCIDSILRQKECTFELIVVDSSTSNEIKSICQAHDKIKYYYISSSGLSEGRNKGLEVSRHDYIAFTDPDCLVDQFWLKNLYGALHGNPKTAIAGGKVVPNWLAKPPFIFKKSRLAWSCLSLLDLSGDCIEVGKIVGANFAINKKLLTEVGYFSQKFGRSKGTLLGGEETELCYKARERGLKIIYTPFAIVEHQIPRLRLTFRWMFRRMYYGGVSRALRGGMPEPGISMPSIHDCIFLAMFILPYLTGLARGKLSKA
jgi:GT2 family glycosyltransferase